MSSLPSISRHRNSMIEANLESSVLKPPNMVGYIAFAMSRDRWNFSRNYENEMSIL